MFAASKTAAVSSAANYIEDVFSTYLYTGNGSTQTITNGIDLSGKGGLVWTKRRDNVSFHGFFDTIRGATNYISSNNTDAQATNATTLTAFNSNGFSLGADANVNRNTNTFVSWTFREQAKFFDVVTYTGDGTSDRSISHALGSTPGCIIVKQLNGATDWNVYHRSATAGGFLYLNSTSAVLGAGLYRAFGATQTSTTFQTGSQASYANDTGATYVAYLFAHDAGGFGLTGTDNVISCGTFTTDGSSNATVNLGYEPQFVLYKKTSSTGQWYIEDTMRGLYAPSTKGNTLIANLTNAEGAANGSILLNSTGFTVSGLANIGASATCIYIAIRRGPMKVPTSGTSVFGLNARSGTGANDTVTGGQTDDAVLVKNRGSAVASLFASRLTGTGYLVTSTTAAEVAAGTTILQANPWDVMDGVKVGTTSTITNATSNTYINYLFKRAPNFMDVVCYTGNSTNQTISHNLGIAPELIIVKKRSSTGQWPVYAQALGATKYVQFNTSSLEVTGVMWNNTAPTASVFSVGADGDSNLSAATYVAYLFSTLAGVSKVGSYTGNGTTQTIDCGLTAGARFVLLKRTDAAGSWYVYDTARGMTVLTDPYWVTNLANAEVASLGSVTTVATGFALNSAIVADININAGTYIFLAIA